MHKAEQFGRAVLWNLVLAVLMFAGLIGLCHAFTVDSFAALGASKQMGVIVAAVLLAAAGLARSAGVLASASMKFQKWLVG